MKENSFFVKLFGSNVDYILSDSEISPEDNKDLFGSLADIAGGLIYDDCLAKSSSRQILRLVNPKNKKVILKRTVIQCSLSGMKELLNNENSKQLINEGITEFEISKLVSAHPAGIIPYGFQLIKLTKQNILVSEFLMEEAGISLTKSLQNIVGNSSKILKYLNQIASVLYYIEMLKIVYNDVKTGNFLIDKNDNIRIIDFNVSHAGAINVTATYHGSDIILGLTDGFASPEALSFFEKEISGKLEKGEKINPWKSDIYSWAILSLILFGVITNSKTLNSLDKFKNPQDHYKIIDLVDQIKLDNNEMEEKYKSLLKVCLDFSPENRITFKNLVRILNSIESAKVNDFKSELYSAVQSKKVKKELIEEIGKMKHEISILQSEKSKLEEDNINLHLNISNIKKESGSSLKLLHKIYTQSSEKDKLDLLINEYLEEFKTEKGQLIINIRKSSTHKHSIIISGQESSSTPDQKEQEDWNFEFSHQIVESTPNKVLFDKAFYENPIDKLKNSYLYYVDRKEAKGRDILHVKNLFSNNFFEASLYKNCGFNNAALHSEKIFYCGGRIEVKCINTTAIVNLVSKEVSFDYELTEPKYEVSLLSTSKGLYCLGGWNIGILKTCETFSDSKRKWEKISPLNIANSGISCFYHNPMHIYIVGGFTSAVERLNIDLPTNQWELLKVANSTPRLFGCCFLLNQEEALIFGGDNTPKPFMVFNTKNLEFKKMPQTFSEYKSFYSSKPIYYSGFIWIVYETNKKIYLIEPLSLEFQEKDIDF